MTGQFFPAGVRAQAQAQAPSPDKYRAADDLSGWIYEELQWVAKDPATRSQLLTEAVSNAWRRPRTDAENQAWLDLLTNEGYALLLKGAIVSSTDAYTAAYNWARQHREIADEQQVLETILKPLGNNYTRLGDYEQALFIHRKALAIAVTGSDKQVLAGVYANLANTSSNMGRPRQSLDYCGQGLAAVDGRSALAGLLLSERADAAMQLGNVPFARESITKSVKVLQDKRQDPSAVYWLLMAYQQAGDIYAGEPAEALQFYKKAYALQSAMSSGVRQRERAKLLLRLGRFYLRTGQPAQAAAWLDKCLSLLLPGESWTSLKEQDLYAENTLADLLFTRAGLARQQKDTDGALRLYTLSFAAAGRLRHQLISGSSREEAVNDTRQRYEDAIGLAWDAWADGHDKKYLSVMLRLMEGSRAQLLLEELQRQQLYRAQFAGDSLTTRIRLLQKALSYYQKEAIGKDDSVIAGQQKQLSWELAQLYKKAPVVDTVADQTSYSPQPYSVLQKGQTARSFFCGSLAIYTLECTPAGISFAEKLPLNSLWQDSLRGWIRTWFGQGEGRMIDHPLTWYRQAFGLYQQLFSLHPLHAGTSYILLTDGALNLLPIDALVTSPAASPSPADWPFVINQAQVSYGWSLSTLKERMHPAGGIGFSGLFISGSYRSMPLLKAIAAERQGLQQLIPDGSWYSDAQATTAAFRKALSSSAVLHISSHAFAKTDSLFVPRIELYDSSFYLFELKTMEHQPDLVVLSACRTGDGKMVSGEGVQSLARAFIGGGTGAVVAGWWDVNDETASRLMQSFYSRLVSQQESAAVKENAALALRAAKLNWLKDPAVNYLHKLPYYWAVLNYQGDPQPLKEAAFSPAQVFSSARHNKALVYGLPALAVIIILVLYRVRRSGKPA